MQPNLALQPTLWRTCRVIANRSRLRMFALLLKHPGQTVSAVADSLKLPLPVASQYLRALEARGLIEVRRVGRRVSYRLPGPSSGSHARGIVEALSETFRLDLDAEATLFKAATAFTHPRRVEIHRALRDKPRTLLELHAATHIPFWALHRHLRKLEDRSFVVSRSGHYVAANQPDPFGRELARAASE